MKILELITRFIFTPTCCICTKTLPFHQKLPFICDDCSISSHLIKMRICPDCNRPRDVDPLFPACPYCNGNNKYRFKSFIAPFYYEGAAKGAILNYKFANKYSSAQTFAYYIALRIKHLDYLKPEVIIPVPSHKKRLKQRGFDHILLICKHLSKFTGIPYDDVLIKIKHTKSQGLLSHKERLANLKGAFTFLPHTYKNVLLVDDIYTTGSTTDEVCKVLKKSGVKEINVSTVALTYYPPDERFD